MRARVPAAPIFTNKPTRRGGLDEDLERVVNRAKPRVRARVEHVFAVVNQPQGFNEVRWRELAKNATRAFAATALANIFLARKRLATCVRPFGAR